jgi:hypothetical protein
MRHGRGVVAGACEDIAQLEMRHRMIGLQLNR